MPYCLPKFLAEEFISRLKSKEIKPEELADMSSANRRMYFSTFLDEKNAQQVNTLFESKLLLKNQQLGMINWAKQVAGMKPEALRDIVSKINKMDKALNPATEDAFLADLVEHKLGTAVTMDEAANISKLAKDTADLKAKVDPNSPAGSDDRMAYGRARVKFSNYVSELKSETTKISLKDRLKPSMIGKNISGVAGMAKSLKASFDDSAIFRQGWKTLLTNPRIWAKNALKSFSDMAKTYGGKEVMDELNADIISRPNYDLMQKAGLDVGTLTEEAYPTALPEKVPVLGKAYKASEVAFTAFVHRMRADVFDKYVDIAKENNIDLTDKKQIESIGKLVNSLTGRGKLPGGLEKAAGAINNVLFSPRLLKANVDVLTSHVGDANFSPFARKQAAINLTKIIVGTATILATANAVKPGSVEWDPRSSDYGKIKIGDTRFDVSGGMSSIVTLASRLATLSSKSSVTGLVTPLNSGKFGSQTGLDVVTNFFENKLSPAAGIIRDLLKGQDFSGNKPTVAGEVSNLLMPLPITNYQELSTNPKSANVLLSVIADAFGIGVNTYSPQTNWSQNPGVELQQFKEKIGDTKFSEANTKYNTMVSDWLDSMKKDTRFQSLTDEQKKTVETNKKDEFKTDVFKQYGFKYLKKPTVKLPKF